MHDILQPSSLSVNKSTTVEPGILLRQVYTHSDQMGRRGCKESLHVFLSTVLPSANCMHHYVHPVFISSF